jgi:hypothetical protein
MTKRERDQIEYAIADLEAFLCFYETEILQTAHKTKIQRAIQRLKEITRKMTRCEHRSGNERCSKQGCRFEIEGQLCKGIVILCKQHRRAWRNQGFILKLLPSFYSFDGRNKNAD